MTFDKSKLNTVIHWRGPSLCSAVAKSEYTYQRQYLDEAIKELERLAKEQALEREGQALDREAKALKENEALQRKLKDAGLDNDGD